jgi:hypothetical protein
MAERDQRETHLFLGEWPDRRSFAEELCGALGEPPDDIDQETVGSICRAFRCLDIDGRVLVFDTA